ncbi:MAG: hypothetical protein QOG23_3545 [Blastocatellia bacterium]|nr:hypothetical protein [Blastocatellia bacterium]
MDRRGNPTAWYTHSAIDFLSCKDFAGRRILEFGAGQSTLWWARRAEFVLALEDNKGWFQQLKPKLSSNVKLEFVNGQMPDIEPGFDIIVVDGLHRVTCAELSTKLMAAGGAIIVDNSDGYWGGEDSRTQPIIDMFRQNGFQRVDFYGWQPGVIVPSCTSLFFKERCFLFEGSENPAAMSV